MQAMAQSRFDVLISEIALPGEDGNSLITQIRALDESQGGQIPAVALTASAGETDRIRALESGFQIHLPKPISAGQLLTVVAGLAARGRKTL